MGGNTPKVTINSSTGEEKHVLGKQYLESGQVYESHPFLFTDGDEMIFDHSNMIDGVGLSKMELIICDEWGTNCETRAVRLNGQVSYWFNDIEGWDGPPGPEYWGCVETSTTYPHSHSYLGPAEAAHADGTLVMPEKYRLGGQVEVGCGNYGYAVEAQKAGWNGVTSSLCATTARLVLDYAEFLNDKVDLVRTSPSCA